MIKLTGWLATAVNVLALVGLVGLVGLVTSFFSIIYGYPRLVLALSRAGYLPTGLSITNMRKVPARALIVPGVFGFLASLSGQGDLMLAVAVVGATISYALMAYSYILLRKSQPQLIRPYRTPGGTFTSGVALVFALVALTGVFAFDPRAFSLTLVLFVAGGAYFFLYSRHHLVAKMAEEEFAAFQQRLNRRRYVWFVYKSGYTQCTDRKNFVTVRSRRGTAVAFITGGRRETLGQGSGTFPL